MSFSEHRHHIRAQLKHLTISVTKKHPLTINSKSWSILHHFFAYFLLKHHYGGWPTKGDEYDQYLTSCWLTN